MPSIKVIQTKWDSLNTINTVTHGVDAIVHMAGMNAKDCAADPVAALEVNGVSTGHLLRSAINNGVKRFVYLSTAHVYGATLAGIINENSCPRATHPYATSHRAGEDMVIAAHLRGVIEGVVIRLSNSYGPPVNKEVNCWTLLINDLCGQAVGGKRMVLRTSGLQRRDFITLTDVCRAIDHLLKLSAAKLGNGVFNVGGKWSPTILDIAKLTAERVFLLTGEQPEIVTSTRGHNKGVQKLEYQISKLIETGYDLSSNINNEIDSVIEFCLRA